MKYDPVGENPFPPDTDSLLINGLALGPPVENPAMVGCNPERGDPVEKEGVVGEGRLVALSKDRETVVVAWKGYGENPGSRYSMLYNYYPAETEVLVYDHTDEHRRRQYRSLVSWPTRPPKKEGR